MDTLLQQVLRRPDLPKLKVEIEHVLDGEAARRAAFYDALRDGDRHEFINGETVMASPARLEHIDCVSGLRDLLSSHVRANGLGRVIAEQAMVRLTRNDYHPDVCFWPKDAAEAFTPKQTVFPAPDFIAEVLSDSTAERDRGVKFVDYAAHGVREYWIVDPAARSVEQYALDDAGREYRLLRKLDAGRLASEVVPGFAVDVAGLFPTAQQ